MINKERLNDVLKQYGKEDKALFQLRHENMLHVDLSPDYPYLDDGSLNKKYVEACIKKAMEVFMFMEFGNNVLVVYFTYMMIGVFVYLLQKKNILQEQGNTLTMMYRDCQ